MTELEEVGLGWVVEQVQEKIHLGHPTETKVNVLVRHKQSKDQPSLLETQNAEYRKGPKATYVVTREYEPNEKLDLLLKAIELSVIQTAEMENHLLQFTRKEIDRTGSIVLVPEEEDEEPVQINKGDVSDRHGSVVHIIAMLLV